VTRNQKTIFLIALILLVSASSYASDKDVTRLQGVVMAIDLKRNLININERSFTWDQGTAFYNEGGIPIGIERIKPNTWVYIEAVTKTRKPPVARKIYHLPRFINEKEKHLYSFIQ